MSVMDKLHMVHSLCWKCSCHCPKGMDAGLSKAGRNRGRKAALFEAEIRSLLRRGLEHPKPHNFASLSGFSRPQHQRKPFQEGRF
jgi:hypothetical protein